MTVAAMRGRNPVPAPGLFPLQGERAADMAERLGGRVLKLEVGGCCPWLAHAPETF